MNENRKLQLSWVAHGYEHDKVFVVSLIHKHMNQGNLPKCCEVFVVLTTDLRQHYRPSGIPSLELPPPIYIPREHVW